MISDIEHLHELICHPYIFFVKVSIHFFYPLKKWLSFKCSLFQIQVYTFCWDFSPRLWLVSILLTVSFEKQNVNFAEVQFMDMKMDIISMNMSIWDHKQFLLYFPVKVHLCWFATPQQAGLVSQSEIRPALPALTAESQPLDCQGSPNYTDF